MSRHVEAPRLRRNTVHSADGTPISYQTMGTGPDLIVLGGSLRSANDYLALASPLTRSFTVHLVDRRGRGASGPQGPDYTLGKEVEDLRAVQAETGARLAFGHSYGGLVILETLRSFHLFDRIVVYEPGLSCSPVPTAWMTPYRERLAAGDPYGAFVHFLQGSGGAPAFLATMPRWYLRMTLRIGLRGPAWQRMLPLLEANLAEHEQIAAQYGRLNEFANIPSPALILCGSRSAAAHRAEFALIRDTLPHATLETLAGFDHLSPSEPKTAVTVGERALPFFT